MAENIADMYKKLETEGLARARVGKGDKADKIRERVGKIAKSIGQPKLLMSAVYKLTKGQLPEGEKLDRSYFSSAIERGWGTTRDADGRVWIHFNQPKPKKLVEPVKPAKAPKV